MKFEERARRVELILSDVDGVLTDGGIIYDNQGIEAKKFHVRDGLGIRLWKRAGFRFGILTARTSHIVKLRSSELDMDVVRQGFEDKLPVAREVMAQFELEPEQVCYIGDDLADLPVMRNVGLAVAVADAVDEVRAAAQFVTNRPGGQGAVREAIEKLLKAKNRWDDLVRKYAN
jgi:3-deoxy-D-manno-octulosonate 8-phosphate phosphatase (KDO 8-P phosphatase)